MVFSIVFCWTLLVFFVLFRLTIVFCPSIYDGATRGAGAVYTSGSPGFIPGFDGCSCCSIFTFLCNVLEIIVVCPFSFGHCIVCLRFTISDYPFGIFNLFLRILITPLVSSNFFLRLLITLFGIFKFFLRLLITALLSSNLSYGYLLPLCYLQIFLTAADYRFVIFKSVLRLLITALLSSNLSYGC